MKTKQLTPKVSLQRAYEKCVRYELCSDLLDRKFAKKSGKSVNEKADEIRHHYHKIVLHLRHLRPASNHEIPDRGCQPASEIPDDLSSSEQVRAALISFFRRRHGENNKPSLSQAWRPRFLTDEDAKMLLADLERCVRIRLDQLNDSAAAQPACVQGEVLDSDLMRLLAKEWTRDAKSLMKFLLDVFRRWRKIDAPQSLWRQRMVTYQIAGIYDHSRKQILDHLQRIGAIDHNLTKSQLRSYLSIIGQFISRDPKKAAASESERSVTGALA